jgi:hypothetical protein
LPLPAARRYFSTPVWGGVWLPGGRLQQVNPLYDYTVGWEFPAGTPNLAADLNKARSEMVGSSNRLSISLPCAESFEESKTGLICFYSDPGLPSGMRMGFRDTEIAVPDTPKTVAAVIKGAYGAGQAAAREARVGRAGRWGADGTAPGLGDGGKAACAGACRADLSPCPSAPRPPLRPAPPNSCSPTHPSGPHPPNLPHTPFPQSSIHPPDVRKVYATDMTAASAPFKSPPTGPPGGGVMLRFSRKSETILGPNGRGDVMFVGMEALEPLITPAWPYPVGGGAL